MSDTPTPTPRWRLDAVALTFAALGVGLGVALATFPQFGLQPENALGSLGDSIAEPLVTALGFGTVALGVAWFVAVMLYATRRPWVRFGVRMLGWTVLVAGSTTAADFAGPRLPAVSAFGAGGSVGAFLRTSLEAQVPEPYSLPALGLGIFLGLVLAADGVVRAMFRGLVRFNRFVAGLADRMLASREKPVVAAPAVPIMQANPFSKKPDKPKVAPSPPPAKTPAAAAAGSANIPITKHDAPLTDTPPPVRVMDRKVAGTNAPVEVARPDYELPPLSLLADPDPSPVVDQEQKLRDRATLLEKTFLDFGVTVKVVGIHAGPVLTQYEISLETGLRLNKVTTLADDVALNLGVSSVRIIAPLPGRNTVGVEVPNEHRQAVRLKEVILTTTAKAAKCKLPIFLGKDVEGRPLVYDMATMPHLLIAGRTGTGKSVCLNTVLTSFLFTRTPDECRLILIDPKKVEFADYGKIPHLMHPVVTDDKKAEAILGWAVDKMEERYELLRRARVRNIASYNELSHEEIIKRANPETVEDREAIPAKLPYIVVVVDEVGDLLMSMKKEVETHIIRLAQKSRAAGIHLILATQKPTVDVITGLIKSNLPARICFQVASRADSMVVLDEKGADKLLGMGDMLFLQPGTSTIIRGQGAYVDDQEIARVTDALQAYEPDFESELLNLKTKDSAGGDSSNLAEKLRDRDPLYEQAVEVVIREQRGSTSLLQRALGIGYGKASRFIDWMAEDGVVGSYNGSNARDVLISTEEWETRKAQD